MRKALLISVLLLWPATAPATESGQCDAKPFSLAKPAPALAKAKPPPPKVQTATAAPVKKEVAKKHAPVVGCKQPADKKSG